MGGCRDSARDGIRCIYYGNEPRLSDLAVQVSTMVMLVCPKETKQLECAQIWTDVVCLLLHGLVEGERYSSHGRRLVSLQR